MRPMNNDTFICDYCKTAHPIAERETHLEAVLSPYPEDVHLCANCAAENEADARELWVRMHEVAEENGDADYLSNN